MENCRRHPLTLVLTALTGILVLGCESSEPTPLSPGEITDPLFAKPGSETVLAADVVAGDGDSVDPWLVSDCPGDVTGNFGVQFDHTRCMVVWPTGSDYPLTDDIAIKVKTRKGGREITEVQLQGQDAIGPGGIMHESEVIVLDPPVATDPNGFTLTLTVDQLPIWRLDGHLSGKRVKKIGTVAVGKVVHRDVTGNDAPTADFSFSCSGLDCSFDGSASADPDGTIRKHAWRLGEDVLKEGATITHSFGASGTYDVTLLVTDEDGGRGALTREVTVDDATADSPPSVAVTNPAGGATVSGVVDVTADATDDNSVAQVEFFVDGGSIGVDSDGADGWAASWDTQGLENGTSHTVGATAADDAGQTASDQVTVTVDNSTDDTTPTALHIGDLDGSGANQGRTWSAVVTALVSDDAGNSVSDATVSGSWSGGASGNDSCTTDGSGWCSVGVGGIRKNEKSVTFTVEDVTHADLGYDTAANTDPDGDSDGTSITVSKP